MHEDADLARPSRRYPRYPYEAQVQVQCLQWDQLRTLSTSDISKGGLFIRTPEPAPPKTPVRLSLSTPSLGRAVVLTGEVAHAIDAARAQELGREAGMGVCFQNIDAAVQRALQQLTEMAQRRGRSASRQIHAFGST